ncbi:MAG: ribosome biogenesis GTP-binding protein YihA/YsxC, partial [Oscillospiraceae bacterium]|nr:ribosome biogenesis GTP-binding protein YihA/YsxC [Oscillospiraceae bacterium]
MHNVEFIKSAASPDAFIRDRLPQIVFSGRSNVGKSSVINKLLNRNNFARVSATPGKTAHVNYFKIDGAAYFVDLPGYGYARVSEHERARWASLMERFFEEPELFTFG